MDKNKEDLIGWCIECGPTNSCDEDLCCSGCGTDLAMIPNYIALESENRELKAKCTKLEEENTYAVDLLAISNREFYRDAKAIKELNAANRSLQDQSERAISAKRACIGVIDQQQKKVTELESKLTAAENRIQELNTELQRHVLVDLERAPDCEQFGEVKEWTGT